MKNAIILTLTLSLAVLHLYFHVRLAQMRFPKEDMLSAMVRKQYAAFCENEEVCAKWEEG